MNNSQKSSGYNKVQALVSAVILTLLCTFSPYLGIFSAIFIAALYAVETASQKNVLSYLTVIPGLALCYFLSRDISLILIICAFILCGLTLGLVMGKGRSASIHVLSCILVYGFFALASFFALCIWKFGSVGGGIKALSDLFTEYALGFIDRLKENDSSGYAEELFKMISPEGLVQSVLLAVPGVAIVTVEVFGYLTSAVSRLFIRMYGLADTLYPTPKNITVPLSYAVLAVISFFISLWGGNGAVSFVGENLSAALRPALILIGLSSLRTTMRFSNPVRKTVICVITVILFFVSPAIILYGLSVSGITAVIFESLKRKRDNP